MPAKGSKEKKAGNPNWKKPILYKVVKTILPTTNAHWTRVIKKYQKLSGDKSHHESRLFTKELLEDSRLRILSSDRDFAENYNQRLILRKQQGQ
jgi:hypothetical protein